ncbi:Imm1 family immunity protein [Occultella kanbiaonis]|uniref:Imm1 family immunity protein n=1 Tax=Occultella kanbiaonis TaxID=2675754 RepID=UPI0013D3720F|nr:Imm1 family immunity protein [Occultella kanbiaonis]
MAVAPTWIVSWSGTWGDPFRGERTISDASELADVLSRRDGGGDAEFMLAAAEAEYPYLSLSVSHDRWYVHYFPEEAEAGAYVIGDDPEAEGIVALPAGSNIEVLAAQLISSAAALRIAGEFLATGTRPAGAEWFDL